MKKRVLFVCTENANRSQMAEAFARIYGPDVVEAFSAGSAPGSGVNPRAVRAMAELGYDLGAHHSKGLDEVPPGPYDCVITMGCGDACPWVPAERRADWDLADPRDLEPEAFNLIRDEIGRRVRALVEELAGVRCRPGAPSSV